MRLKILWDSFLTATGEYVRNWEVRSTLCFRNAPGMLMRSCGYWSGKYVDDKVGGLIRLLVITLDPKTA